MITKNPMQLKAFIKKFLICSIAGLDMRATMDLDTIIKEFTLTHGRLAPQV